MKNGVSRFTLSNGLMVLCRQTPTDPISAAHLFIPEGASSEPIGKKGETVLLWSLFLKGTKKRSAKKMAEDIESIGAYLSGGATHDYSEFSCHATSDHFFEAMDLLGEGLLEMVFSQEELEKEKLATLAAIRSKQENIFTVTMESLYHEMFPNHPYGNPSSGTEQDVSVLTKEDLENRYKKILNPTGAVLSIATDKTPEIMQPFLEGLLGERRWPAGSTHPHTDMGSTPKLKNPIAKKNFSSFEQSYVMIGYPAAPATSPEYVALKVMTAILGGGMSRRLFQTLREKEGLAYDVGLFYPSRKWGSSLTFHIGLHHSKIEEAKHSILKLIQELQKDLVPVEELEQVKSNLKGSFILDHQTNSQRSHYLGWWENLGLGAEYDQTYISLIDGITPEQIRRVAQIYFSEPSVTVETWPMPEGKANSVT
jgi:zinc protease